MIGQIADAERHFLGEREGCAKINQVHEEKVTEKSAVEKEHPRRRTLQAQRAQRINQSISFLMSFPSRLLKLLFAGPWEAELRKQHLQALLHLRLAGGHC